MKKALIVGINSYTFQKSLRGCINDANLLRSVLMDNCGFDAVSVITDDIDKNRLLEELDSLLHIQAGESDPIRAFHFSGHGGRAMDKDGDEPDRIDEVLCLPNYQWQDQDSFVSDDTLRLLLDRDYLKNRDVKLYMTCDSCHSGSITRAIDIGWPEIEERCIAENDLPLSALSSDWRVEEINPIYTVTREASDSPAVQDAIENDTGYSTEKPTPTSHLVLTGCTAAQTCKDVPIEGTYHGIFSYVFANAIASSPDISWTSLQQVVSDIISEKFNQDVQLEGLSDLTSRSVFT